MPAAFAVVGGLVIQLSVVVIENQMLAFVADDFRYALKIFRVFADEKLKPFLPHK
jgi:hypothetical protein